MKQLNTLKQEFGYDLYSALEYEFVLLEGREGSEPVFFGSDICSTFGKFLYPSINIQAIV